MSTIDLFDPDVFAHGDPHATWSLMRASAPTHWQDLSDGRGFWSVTRYADVRRVLVDHASFTSTRGNMLANLGRPDPASHKIMTSSDPPGHGELREPLNRMFSHKAILGYQEHIRRCVRDVLRPIEDGPPWDLAVAVARLPVALVAPLMGIPEADWARLARYSSMAVAPDDEEFMDGNRDLTVITGHYELFTYLSDSVAAASAGSNQVAATLLASRSSGCPLDHETVVYNCYSVLLGANVTMPHVIATMVRSLIADPDAYARLTADPGLLDTAVEEGLRRASPANHFVRHAVRDVRINDQLIRAGDPVAAWIGSANHDDRVFARPYTFDVARSPNPHLAFGAGRHYCLGAPLARLGLRIFFEELLARAERMEPAGPVEYIRSNFVAGIKHLPIVVSLR